MRLTFTTIYYKSFQHNYLCILGGSQQSVMILQYPPITLDTYQVANGQKGIPIAWWIGEHILSGYEKVETEQGFLMLLRIRFYYLKKLMTGLFLEFSIFLEPRVTDNKGSIILRSMDDYSICPIVFSRSKPPLTQEVVITWENCITPPTTLSLGFATRSSPTLCSPENGSKGQGNQPKGFLEFEEFHFAFTTWVRALWYLEAELGRDMRHTSGQDFIFRKKAVSRKHRKENQENSELASDASRPVSLLFLWVGYAGQQR